MSEHSRITGVVYSAMLMLALGCSSDEKPPARAAETTVTVVFNDGHQETMPMSALDESTQKRDDIKGVLATDRQTRETVVITFDEARQQRPSTGKYVVLQNVAPKAETK